MKISVVITTYNGKEYVMEQLSSIKQQSRKADEVLIFDDGSSDGTDYMIRQYIEQNELDDWFFVKNEINKGWKRNFKDAILAAKGELIFLCDQDDIWNREKLEKMEAIMTSNEGIALLVSNYKMLGGKKNGNIVPCVDDKCIVKQVLSNNIFKIPYPGCTYCIRKTLIDRCTKFWEVSFPHDAFLWRIALFNDSLYSYNECLMEWRIHSDSAFSIEKLSSRSTQKRKEWIRYANLMLEALFNFLEENNGVKTKYKIIKMNKSWLDLRKQLFETKNLLIWLSLIRYIGCYPVKKQYLSDLLYVFRNNLV